MNKWIFFGLVLGCLILPGAASAQSVNFPTGNCAWTVKMTPFTASDEGGATATPAPPAIKALAKAATVEVTQVDNLKRIRITWTDGKTSEEWTVPKMPVVFKEDPRNGNVFPVQASTMEMQYERSTMRYDVSAFSWLNAQTLKEQAPITYQGKSCFHYFVAGVSKAPTAKDFAPGGIGYNATVNTPTMEAWIEAKTLLPIALHEGPSLYTFTFPPTPPTDPLVLPAKFKKEVDYYKMVMGYPATP